jgi:hypothetical protein
MTKTNHHHSARRLVALFGIAALASTSLLGLTVTQASAASSFCPTVRQYATTGKLSFTLQPGDSFAAAANKVKNTRTSYVSIRRIAPSSMQADLANIANGLGRAYNDLVSMRRLSGSRLEALRSRIERQLDDTDIQITSWAIDVSDYCSFEVSLGGDEIAAIEEIPAVPLSPTPTVAPSVATRGTIPGTAVLEIGKDIAPGFYTTRGGVNCRAGQSNEPTGTDPAEGFVVPIGVGVVTQEVSASYRYFITENCAPWVPGTRAG